MNMQQIQSFLVVCDQKSFTKASEKLYTSQPVVSRQIASLENEIGFRLFIRNKNGEIKLTEQGKVYADFMRKFLNDYSKMLGSVDKSLKLKMGFCSERTPDPDVQDAVNKMWQAYGFESVSVRFMSLTDILQAVYEETIDIAYVDEHVILNCSKSMNTAYVRSTNVRLLMSEKHPLADKKDLSLGDFKESTFIRLESWMPPQTEPGEQVFEILTELYKKADPKKRSFIIAPDSSSLQFWCRTNRGVAIVLIWDERDFNLDQCSLRGVPELGKENEVLAWRKDNKNPLVQEFIRHFEENRKKRV